MRIQFPASAEPSGVIKQLEERLGGRRLGDLLSFEVQPKQVVIRVSKLGTSKIVFHVETIPEGFIWQLAEERLAFAHRPFRNDVFERIQTLVEELGGQWTNPSS